MTKGNKDKVVIPATTDSTCTNRICHWGKVLVMCLSGGFIFPHALTDGDNIVKHDADKEVTAKKL